MIRKTTESSRKRHTFRSFKERVDSLKIEPHLNLRKRVHDYAETSHFLACLEHWREVNISGNFTAFLDKVEGVSQTLPQILHHQDAIFEALCVHIEVLDNHSLQPLFELLAQFIHDLGPDFMPFYQRYLELVLNVVMTMNPNDSQNNIGASHVLEWAFNCLAFTFKYLSRTLTDDLIPTFDVLMPILQLQKRTYLSRFCAEALSFLVRKLKPQSMERIIDHTMQKELILENDEYAKTLVVLYSEAMKNTKETFHTKSTAILAKLVSKSLEVGEPKYISIVSDILLDVLHHGSKDECKNFYKLSLEIILDQIQKSQHQYQFVALSQILVVLSFAESGRKVPSWDSLVAVVIELISKLQDFIDYVLLESLLYLMVVLVRNADFEVLTKYHLQIFDFAIKINEGDSFLAFVEASSKVSKERLYNLGIKKYVQDYALKYAKGDSQRMKLAVFLSRNNIDYVIIPKSIQASLIEELPSQLSTEKDLLDVYWKFLLLKYSAPLEQDNEKSKVLHLLQGLISNKDLDSKFSKDVAAVLLDSIALTVTDSSDLANVLNNILDNLERFQLSSIFIASLTKLLSCKDLDFMGFVESSSKWKVTSLESQLAQNLALPHHDSRYNTILLLRKLFELEGKEIPQVLHDIRVLEEVPLILHNGRDITLRIRNLGIDFKKNDNANDLEKQIISHYVFGLLTNKFQPCWSAVAEMVPTLLECGCSDYIWNLAYKFICFNYGSQNEEYYDPSVEMASVNDDSDSQILEWQASSSRLSANFQVAHDEHFSKYYWILQSVFAYAQGVSANNTYSSVMRTRALEVLAVLPSVAEKNSTKLAPLVLRSRQDDVLELSETPESELWTLKDRNDLMTLFTKFRKLRKIPDADEIYQHALRLLCHKQLPVQKIALDVVLNYNNPSVNKYRDNLRNLLDDTIFRDEITKFIVKGSDSAIEAQDVDDLMPLVLRILFGRVQGTPRSNSKLGKKFAVISVLPNLTKSQMIEFLSLGSLRTGYVEFFETASLPPIDHFILRRLSGFVSLLAEVYDTLGPNFNDVLATTIKPLVFSLVLSQAAIDDESLAKEDATLIKSARNVRQNGLRCLNELFDLLGESFDWTEYVPYVYDLIVKPRLENFAAENLQQPSALLKTMTKWIKSENMNILLYTDEYAVTSAIVSLLANRNAKDSVTDLVVDFAINALSRKDIIDERNYTLLAILVDALLQNLTEILDRSEDKELNSKIIEILLLLIDGSYIDDDSTRANFVGALTKALDKPQSQLEQKDKANLLTSLSAIIIDYDCTFEDLLPLYNACSKGLRTFADVNVRNTVVSVFQSIGLKFEEFSIVGNLVEELNSFSKKRISEPDFQRRLAAYKQINEDLYKELTSVQWLPLLYTALFFINYDDELALRTSSTYLLTRFVDCFSEKETAEEAKPYIHVLKDIILPYLRIGLRNNNETVQTEYISFLSHIVEKAQYFDDFDDMKVLLFRNDEEANFFKNINHIQLHRRQRAIKRVAELRHSLNDNSIAHYILPMIEHYCICTDEKMRNITNEAIASISLLIRCVSWNQYKAMFRRYIANIKTSKIELLKDHVALVVVVAASLKESVANANNSAEDVDVIKNMPKDQADIDKYVTTELLPPLTTILNKRDDETIVARVPLCEALASLLLAISNDLIEKKLPGTLTSTCQVMRSRSEELRDAVRKTLARIAVMLGPKYFKFIIKELKTALSRGSQIHVLSFTVHSLLVATSDAFSHGDLDDSVVEIIDIIMEDTFGAAGQEKDAEGYHSKMKEVKHKKSYDSAEIVASAVSLSQFGSLIEPVKLLLNENLSKKVENKLDELLKRYALGLNHNGEASSLKVLQLSYEVHSQSASILKPKFNGTPKPVSEVEDHFLVKLDAKSAKTQVEYSQYIATLQKFSFEILKAALSRNPDLLKPELLEGFIPLLEQGLKSDNEGINIACLRVLNVVVRLPFSEEVDNMFKTCTRSALAFVKDSPSTNSEICQASLKFLATVIRHKPDITIKHTTLSYLLVRLQPDLEEPNRQGLAFNFLKAVVSQHIMIPEVYDTMEKVSKNMIVNHAKEIRDMARSVYFLFLMEYDQGRGKLEKQFKFLVNNLAYPTQEGRQSVMELLHLIINKCGEQLLIKLSTSFFVVLANVVVNDDSPKCREMATSLISSMFRKLGIDKVETFEKYISAWLSQSNPLLKRCAFLVYRIYITEFSYGANQSLDDLALRNVEAVLESATSGTAEANWEYVYVVLNVFSTVAGSLEHEVLGARYGKLWHLVFDVLLFPHAWVRLAASRLVTLVLSNLDECKFTITPYQIQTLAYRLLRQLGAPLISEGMGTQVVKNLVLIAMHWEKNNTKYQTKPAQGHDDDEEQADEDNTKDTSYEYAIELIVRKLAGILRLEHNYRNSFQSKKSAIQLSAMLVQSVSQERLLFVVEHVLLSLYNFTELDANNSDEELELVNLTMECMQMCETKLGVTEYTQIYSKVKQQVQQRRVDRKTKRAQMAISNPEVAALRKLKKHQRGREKRKHDKDDNGFYRSKKNRFK